MWNYSAIELLQLVIQPNHAHQKKERERERETESSSLFFGDFIESLFVSFGSLYVLTVFTIIYATGT